MERTAPPALAALQEQLWQRITEADEDDSACAPPRGAILDAHGIAVYANAYFSRIHDCLREDFPALARALGADAFHDLVKTYLMCQPPCRPSLRHVGAGLAPHLATPPFAAIFARGCPYAADLARLEWALCEAFFAPDAPRLSREDLASVPPADWSGLRFELSPSLALLRCAWPVERVRERCERAGDTATWTQAPRLARRQTCLRVWRRDERVRYRRVSALELDVLNGVRAGEPFQALCERIAAAPGERDAAAGAASLLATWISDGLLARRIRADARVC